MPQSQQCKRLGENKMINVIEINKANNILILKKKKKKLEVLEKSNFNQKGNNENVYFC